MQTLAVKQNGYRTKSILQPVQDETTTKRVFLSPPHMSGLELEMVRDAFQSNWIAPLGPDVDAFEQEVAQLIGVKYAVALSSGTAAIHLALRLLDVSHGDTVICPTLTFAATANPIIYEGGIPIFIDCDRKTWNIDPNLLYEELKSAARRNKLPRAVITVDLYGQSADYDDICAICAEYDIPVIEDAAEALGATYKGKMVGGFGKFGIFSFNGNKIITTSGGGMLVSKEGGLIERAVFLASQARDPLPYYQHSTIGYNYRLSNILAAVGRAQLRVLPERVAARQRNFKNYVAALSDLPGIDFIPLAEYGISNCWLTCITIDPQLFGSTPEELQMAMEAVNIEPRRTWKPLHLQPVFSSYRVRGGQVSKDIFERGLCLPSGSNLSEEDFDRVVNFLRDWFYSKNGVKRARGSIAINSNGKCSD